MPLVSSPASPWESYPFRHSSGSATMSLNSSSSGSINGSQSSQLPSQPKVGSQQSFRDITMSPSSRGSVSSGSNTMVNPRGSLSSLGSIGTISSRASMASVGSLPNMDSSAASAVGNGSEPSLMWQQHDDAASITPISAKNSVGSVLGATTAIGQNVTVNVQGLPRDITARETHLMFALASDFSSVELNRNAVSGEMSLSAKFNSLHGAQQAAQALERRSDLFGSEIKTSVQSYSSPFVSQANTPRSIYPSRPLFAESYWSQQPATPLSPSAGPEFFNGSRRQSLISPTEPLYSTSTLGQVNLGPSASPSHQSNPDNSVHPASNGGSAQANTSPYPSAAAAAVAAMSGNTSASPGPTAARPHLHHGPSPTSAASAIGTGVPAAGQLPVHAGNKLAQRPSLSSLHSSNTFGHSQDQIHPQAQDPSVPQLASQSSSHNQAGMIDPNQPNSGSPHTQHQYSQDAQKIPPPNPADQNPPCNTLYVGNLPPDTSESELKELFSQQQGYRRLCFRTKQNGPMCFVEFEDESLAGKALGELYGHVLSNSVKGGIRLSYSKNPLGVRSRPTRR